MTMAPRGHEDQNDTLALNEMRVHAMQMQCTVHVTFSSSAYTSDGRYRGGRNPTTPRLATCGGNPTYYYRVWVGPQQLMCTGGSAEECG